MVLALLAEFKRLRESPSQGEGCSVYDCESCLELEDDVQTLEREVERLKKKIERASSELT